jgi:ribosomal RNA-processing protein 36
MADARQDDNGQDTKPKRKSGAVGGSDDDTGEEAWESKDGEDDAAEDSGGSEDAENESDKSDESEEEEEGDAPDEEAARHRIGTVSFGALVKAQASLRSRRPEKRPRGAAAADDEGRLEALRARLRELRDARGRDAAPAAGDRWGGGGGTRSGTVWGIAHGDSGSDDDDDDDRGEDDGGEDGDARAAKSRRQSKHAPAEMSSKRPVSRKRSVIETPKPRVRDPRFDSALGAVNREQVRRNYAFVDGYVDDEIGALKRTLKEQKALAAEPGNNNRRRKKKKKPKGVEKMSAEELEELKRELNRKESRRAAQAARDREAEVRRDHRRGEREKVAEGKRPFYLKRSEVREEVVRKRYGEVGEGKRERMMERRRKKVASKERRRMPAARRTAG